MLWIPLALFGVAIALWRCSRNQPDEVSKFLMLAGALISLMAGLVLAPLPLKVLSLSAILVYPTCAHRTLRPDCPRLCPLRHHCKPPSTLF